MQSPPASPIKPNKQSGFLPSVQLRPNAIAAKRSRSTGPSPPTSPSTATPPSLPPAYFLYAQRVVKELRTVPDDDNVYGFNDAFINLQDRKARTVCANFVTLCIRQAYGMSKPDFKNWMGSTSPFSRDYHHAIVRELNGFRRVHYVEDIKPGDFAVSAYSRSLPDGSTGHTMLVISVTPRPIPKEPIVEGTVQFDVWISDSTRSFHGPMDTRFGKQLPGGIGSGVLRIYARPEHAEVPATARNHDDDEEEEHKSSASTFSARLGQSVVKSAICGYAWSVYPNSAYYSLESERHFVVGRVVEPPWTEPKLPIAGVQQLLAPPVRLVPKGTNKGRGTQSRTASQQRQPQQQPAASPPDGALLQQLEE